MSFVVYSQDNPKHDGQNEFKANIGSLLADLPEIGYEYLLNEESGLGISVAFSIDDDVSYRFMTFPYYRMYFGKKKASGFFIEGNSAVFFQRIQRSAFFGTVNDPTTDASVMGFGLGIAIGGKFLTKSAFIGELYVGGGRNFINTDKINEGYPRIGISIGKRF